MSPPSSSNSLHIKNEQYREREM